jgi:beta-N-acetylhexosaminidase
MLIDLTFKKLILNTSLILITGSFVSNTSIISPEKPAPKKTIVTLAPPQKETAEQKFAREREIWVNTVMSEMTLDEKIGQLFMVSAYSNRNEADYAKLEEQIKRLHLGGVIFFQGDPITQAKLTNRYQAASKTPLMIGIDGEWGLGMRLDNSVSFPKAITLGATQDPELMERVGAEIGRQCKRIGININFAPVADLNSNPKNPVINYRSFGESKTIASGMLSGFSAGMKEQGVMACAKHFPGHGDTEVDSHRSLPVLDHNKKRLDDIETYPFKKLFADSIGSVMIGHLYVPTLESQANTPASVSKKIIDGYLKGELRYNGLVFTDALNMRGLLRYYPIGDAEVEAFKAGNDVLLQTANVEVAFNRIKERLLDSTISVNDLDFKVKRILQSKFWMGLNHYTPVDLKNIQYDINNAESENLIAEVYDKAITVVKDFDNLLPIKSLTQLSYASVAIGAKPDNEFQKTLNLYGPIKSYTMPFKPTKSSEYAWLSDEASKHDLVIFSVHDTHNLNSRDFGITKETISFISEVAKKTRVVVCVFGNPYSLALFNDFETLMCGYQDEKWAQIAAANVIFGVNSSAGKIPVNTLSSDAKLNDGIKTLALGRIGFDGSSGQNIDLNKLGEIDYIVSQAIKNGEFPGCEILVAQNGKILYNKNFGNLRYNFNESVTDFVSYDIASLTKVSATLQIIMRLYDQKKLDLNKRVSEYVPELRNTDKQNITIKELLLHESGLKAFYPFWKKTVLEKDAFNPAYYSTSDSTNQMLKVAENLYIIPTIQDSVLKWIVESPLSTSKKYVYSDLGLLLLQRVVENISQKPLDQLVDDSFYKPLGMINTGYNIYKKKPKENIAPTEIEQLFRNSAIWGTVHDPNAALLGGVAGHAGLFSNTIDLAKLFQMNLNRGTYAGNSYFSPKTIDYFTEDQSSQTHRGLGWNKPKDNDGSVSEYASDETYGHTGFTGTVAWVDPKKDLIFIFLANRVYPSSTNNKLLANKTRKRIHDVVYRALR